MATYRSTWVSAGMNGPRAPIWPNRPKQYNEYALLWLYNALPYSTHTTDADSIVRQLMFSKQIELLRARQVHIRQTEKTLSEPESIQNFLV